MSGNLKIIIKKNNVSIVAIALFFVFIFSLIALPVEAHETECITFVYELKESGLVQENFIEEIPCPKRETFAQCLKNAGYSEDDKVVAAGTACHEHKVRDGTGATDSPSAVGEAGKRIGEIIAPIVSKLGNIVGKMKVVPGKIKEKVGEIKDKIINKLPWVDDKDLEELTEEDFADNSIEGTGFNEFRTGKYPDKNGVKIAKIVDPYGKERYTSDGKHFYDDPYSAAHSGEGLRNISNKIRDAWNDFKGVFSFKAKLKDKDKELQREIAREVLKDAQSQKEKDVEKAYKKLSDRITAPKFGDIPAKAIVEIAKEASATDFAGGVLLYIELRKEGNSLTFIRENISEELSEGYGTFGEGVSFSTTNKYAKAVIYARYEETYQRYLLAKELGRKK